MLAALFTLASALPAAAAPPKTCRMQVIGELKVDFSNEQPKVTGAVNGRPIVILIDTGAQMSVILRSAAQRLGLKLTDLWNYEAYGVGGKTKAQSAWIDQLTVAGATRKGLAMVVAGERAGDEDMLLGEDFLSLVDEEFDLAHGVLRLLRPTNCNDQDMPYWATSYAQADFTGDGAGDEHIVLQARLNGVPVRAILDSGAGTSIATTGAGARAGVTFRQDAPAGLVSGLGRSVVREQVGRLASFTLGDETIRNTSLMFGDLYHAVRLEQNGSRLSAGVAGSNGLQELLLGADFLRAHRVLISHARHKIFFTYNGGPVFDARDSPVPASAPAAPPPPKTGG